MVGADGRRRRGWEDHERALRLGRDAPERLGHPERHRERYRLLGQAQQGRLHGPELPHRHVCLGRPARARSKDRGRPLRWSARLVSTPAKLAA